MARLTGFIAGLARWGLGLCALLLILLALYVSLGRQFIGLVAEYDAEVEAKASAALGMPVSIGSLEGRWSRLAPVILAHDVTVGQGASAVRLDQVRVLPDVWGSLLARAPRIEHLEVSGLQVALAEDAAGKWSLKGLPSRDDKPFDPEQILRQMQQVHRLSVLDSQLTLQPFEHEPMTLTYVGVSLRSGASSQRLDVRLNLPDGQPLAFNLATRIRAERWREGSAKAYLNLPQSDWAQWLPARYTQRWRVEALKAGGEFWLDWADGTVQSAVTRLNAPTLRAAYAERKPYAIDDLALNAWFQRNAEGFDLNLSSLAMTLGKDRWESHVALRQSAASDGHEETWHVQADRLDLTPITPLLDALIPLPENVAPVVDGLKVTGALRNVLLDIRPKASGDQRLSYAANLEKVGFNAYHGAPAAGNVSGSLSGNLGQGELRLATDDFMLHLDPIFDKPWHYLKANARLNFKLDQQGFTLIAPYIKVLGEEGQVAADFLIRLPFDHDVEPYMDLRVGLVEGDGAYTSKYLPEALSPAVDQWLRTAVKQGAVEQGYFQYQGSLAKAAPAHSRSITLFFKVHDAVLAFQPGWPEARKVDGNVYIQDGDVRIEASKGQILDTQVRDVSVTVPHVPLGEPSHLYVKGTFDGGLADGLKILQDAPIGTDEIFAGWEGEGPIKGKLDLDVPLVKGLEPKVVVDFNTVGARLKIKSPELELSQLKGAFRFDFDKGLSGQGITARAFDRPVNAQIFAEGKPGSPRTRLTASSQIGVKRLADWLQVKQALPASGDIDYQLQLLLAGSSSELAVNSNLKGVSIDLPAPFGKAVDEARDTAFRMNLQGPERRIDVTYAGLASFVYAAPPAALAEGRGELLIGQANAQLPTAKGLRVRGTFDTLDLDPWQQQAQNYTGGDPAGSAKQVLNEVDLRVGTLKGFGQQLDQASVQLKRSASAWNLAVASQQITGKVTLPDAKGVPIDVNLDTVRLPPVDPDAIKPDNPVEAPDPLASVDPRKIPAVDVKILKLLQGDSLIGAWSLKLRPTTNGVALNDLDLGLKGLLLQGAAGWEGAPGASSTWFKGRLEGKNLADVLKAWNFAPTVTSRDFHLDADGRWPGSPAWVGLKRYSGSLDATLRDGQFVEVEGGAQALRVFGLLNFNSIGRRLRLDFSDVLGKGLSYDRVKGLLVASDGVYVTRTPITMEGPSTNIELNGTLDMVNDQVNAKLQVALPITNSLPIAALLVGAPAVGGALFLVDKLLGDRVSRFASVQYRIEGPWKDPKMTLDRPFAK
jgi:uncharacterized protein (TIGR02099 family)